MMVIKDWNRYETKPNEVFHFSHSLRPFVQVVNSNLDYLFLDLDEMVIYTLEELERDGLDFFRDPNDENFQGVAVNGCIKIKWGE